MKYGFESLLHGLQNGMTGRTLLFCMILTALTSGCYFDQFTNVENAASLRVGMSKAEVLAIMGEPAEVELSSPDLWFYFIRSKWHDGMITEDECLPVVFADEQVIGWGNRFYSAYRLEEKNFYRPQAYEDIPLPENDAPVSSVDDLIAQKEAEGGFTIPEDREE